MTQRLWSIAAIACCCLLCATCNETESKYGTLCKCYCEKLISELDDCIVQLSGCNLKAQTYSAYVSECRDDCVASFEMLSSDERPGVKVCVECLCDTVSDPACGDIAITAEGPCDCDDDNLDEFNYSIGVPNPGDVDLDC
ncbi:MAG: hypothetical protein JRF63_02685 [Deltaproteobacteria bacterium]|nr:hypothetical protein [Deltaproteobacteria bacterium]